MTYGEGVNLAEQQAAVPPDWDDFSVKDVIDPSPEPTSRAVRADVTRPETQPRL